MRATNWLWAAAILAVAPACKMNGNDSAAGNGQEKDQVKSAQKQAQDGFKQAEDAQKQAMKQQDDAKTAQSDVEKARQTLQDKEQKAKQSQAQAEQAQSHAQQQGQAAQQTATESQQRASQALQQQQQAAIEQQQKSAQQQAASAGQPQTPGAGGEQQIAGKLAQASDTELRLDSAPQPLKIDSSTKVTLDGQPSAAAQLPAGSDVRASYRADGTAIRVEAKSAQK